MANRKYTDAQRAEATAQILTRGQPLALVAREMSVSVSTVQRWVSDALIANAAHGIVPAPAPEAPAGQREDLEARLRDAIHRLANLEAQLERLVRGTRVAGSAQ